MIANKIQLGTVAMFCCVMSGWVWAQAPATPGGKEFASVTELQVYFNQKMEDARLSIEKERQAALKAYLPKAKPEEKENVQLSLIQSAMILKQYDEVLALTDSFLSSYSQSAQRWDVRGMRTNALLKLGRLEQARKEWELATENFEKDQSQRDFTQAVFETGMEIADGYLDKLDTQGTAEMYDLIAKKLSYLGQQLKPILDPQREALAWIGKEPPTLEGKDLDGKPVDWAAYRGKVVMLDFWATWCGPCMAMLPELQGMYREYHDEGFEVVGVSLDYDLTSLKTFLKKQALPWRNIYDGDVNGANARKFGVTAIPRTFIINREGKIIRAAMPGEGYAQFIRRLLDQPAPTKS